jgi:serine/threonine protein kinase
MSEEEYSEKSDVYAHAIMMHELLTRQHPYDEFGWKYMWMLEEGVRAGHRPSFPPDCLPRYRALIEDAWHPKPSARPTFAEITRRLEEIIADTCPGTSIHPLSSRLLSLPVLCARGSL